MNDISGLVHLLNVAGASLARMEQQLAQADARIRELEAAQEGSPKSA